MSDTPESPQPTIASMTPAQRTALARELGVAGYHKRLLSETAAARAAAAPTVPTAAPHAAMAAFHATHGLAESECVDLTTLDDAQRRQWIGKHGLARYTAKLHQDLRGKTNFLGRRR